MPQTGPYHVKMTLACTLLILSGKLFYTKASKL